MNDKLSNEENKKLREKINLKLRESLENKDLSVISSNCNGSLMLNDLGLQYKSPFVNLYLRPKHFIQYLSNIDYYNSQELRFVVDKKEQYPIAFLDDVEIRFLHYKTDQEAKHKWEERLKRLNLNNLFIMMTERDGCTYEDLKRFDALPFNNKVVFTYKHYPDIDSSFYVKGFTKDKQVGLLLDFYGLEGHRYYDQFDFVSWFNGTSLDTLKNKEDYINMINQVPKNDISKLWIADSKLYIEGLLYIEGFNSPNYTYLFKSMRLSNNSGDVFEYELGTVPRKELAKTNYNGKVFDYTAAGTATMGLKGIDLSDLPMGVYQIDLSVSNERGIKDFIPLSTTMKELDSHYNDNYFSYRLTSYKGNTFLIKREILGRRVESSAYVSLDNSWVKDRLFHIEGHFIVPGADLTEFNHGKYYVVLKKESTQKQYSFELGQVKKNALSPKIDNLFGFYNACYYATRMFNGISASEFELGLYDIYLSLAYRSEIFTVKLDKQLNVELYGCELI